MDVITDQANGAGGEYCEAFRVKQVIRLLDSCFQFFEMILDKK